MKYRIWLLYGSGWSTGRYMEDSGATQEADSPEQALEDAHRRGIGWGSGYDPQYIKAVAIPASSTDED